MIGWILPLRYERWLPSCRFWATLSAVVFTLFPFFTSLFPLYKRPQMNHCHPFLGCTLKNFSMLKPHFTSLFSAVSIPPSIQIAPCVGRGMAYAYWESVKTCRIFLSHAKKAQVRTVNSSLGAGASVWWPPPFL